MERRNERAGESGERRCLAPRQAALWQQPVEPETAAGGGKRQEESRESQGAAAGRDCASFMNRGGTMAHGRAGHYRISKRENQLV